MCNYQARSDKDLKEHVFEEHAELLEVSQEGLREVSQKDDGKTICINFSNNKKKECKKLDLVKTEKLTGFQYSFDSRHRYKLYLSFSNQLDKLMQRIICYNQNSFAQCV